MMTLAFILAGLLFGAECIGVAIGDWLANREERMASQPRKRSTGRAQPSGGGRR